MCNFIKIVTVDGICHSYTVGERNVLEINIGDKGIYVKTKNRVRVHRMDTIEYFDFKPNTYFQEFVNEMENIN